MTELWHFHQNRMDEYVDCVTYHKKKQDKLYKKILEVR